MNLHWVDVVVLLVYFAAMIGIGVAVVRRASKDISSYFLAGHTIPWYILGMSNASAMFDITGTMWLVYNIFVYGMKGIWLPWLWPTFNQIFLMVYLSVWIRRSNVLTGAEWMTVRFGKGLGAELSRMIVVVFALISVVGFIAYDFQGMGKFTKVFFPWDWSPNTYGAVIMAVTATYVLLGGMISVVLTDLAQFVIMAICSLFIAVIAMRQVSPEMLAAVVPQGWFGVWPTATLNLDWGHLIPTLEGNIARDGYSFFAFFFVAMLFKGVLVSAAGPAPNYDMQRILAAKTPRESALMSAVVSAALLPRWWMIGGITVLALVGLGPKFATMPTADFEMVLPWVIQEFIPVGLLGLLLAGLLSAFMSTFSATLNAGGAYLVNDLYKRYIKTDAAPRHYVWAGWIAQIVILVVGVFFGTLATSINQVTLWIVSALWGGYTAPNILKWHWHRFNGHGYFWGMLGGLLSAAPFTVPQVAEALMPNVAPDLRPFWGFPFIVVISLVFCVVGSLLTAPEPEEDLKRFYKRTRPWGFWGPIRDKVMAEDPSFRPNRGFLRDTVNVVVAMAAQMTLVTIPLYMVLWHMKGLWISVLILLVTGCILKFTWYDKLDPEPDAEAEAH
jgi:SSS family solute:Na+ symporter